MNHNQREKKIDLITREDFLSCDMKAQWDYPNDKKSQMINELLNYINLHTKKINEVIDYLNKK